jgi:replicative DNA helicase
MKPQNHDFLSKPLPCDVEAERIVLGCILTGHSQSGEILQTVSPVDFSDPKHQAIFTGMQKLWSESTPIETTSLYAQLLGTGDAERAGGAGYISTIGDGIHSKISVDHYLARVMETKLRRELIHSSRLIQETAFAADQEGVDAATVLDLAMEKLSALREKAKALHCGVPNFDAGVNLLFSLKSPDRKIVRTGLPTLDLNVGGMRAGEVVILTAETGVGKTFLALQISQLACASRQHTLYCSGEMLACHLMGRIISADSQVPYWKIRSAEKISEVEMYAIFESVNRQCKTCRILDGELTLPNIRTAARSMGKELGCVVVDYDELVEVHGKDEWDQQRIMVRSLKLLAMECKIPMLIVSQLRKPPEAKDRRSPTLHNLYGSGAKSKHASIVLYVERPYVQELKGDETEAIVYILKSRDGRLGKIDCKFNTKTFHFEEVSNERSAP